jgi:hypothetical protein
VANLRDVGIEKHSIRLFDHMIVKGLALHTLYKRKYKVHVLRYGVSYPIYELFCS